MEKKWKKLPSEECDVCGEREVEVLTDAPEGSAFDGDSVRCGCGATGCAVVEDNDSEDEDDEFSGVLWVDWNGDASNVDIE